MRFILFSDVHCDRDACESIVQRTVGADFAIGAGDFGLLRNGLQGTIDVLAEIEIPTILVHGNHESPVELADACTGLKNFYVLHGTEVEIGGISFFGIGAGIPETPFGPWTVDLSEEEAAALLSRRAGEFVFVTHSPPFGCLDTLSNQQHVGSRAVRAFVEETRPGFVVCGHIHENAHRLGDVDGVPVINAGPAGFEFEYPG